MAVRTGASETVGGMLVSAGRRFGGRLAVTDAAGRDRTYSELLQRGTRFANVLHGLGTRSGDHVAAMLEDRSEAVEVYVGIMLAGCVLVHVNARHSAAELVHLLSDGEVKVLVHTSGVAHAVADAVAQSDLKAIITIGEVDGFESMDFEAALVAASTAVPAEQRVPEDLAILAYTSGTTGRPKGAMVSHRSVVSCSRVAPYYYGLDTGSRVAYAASFSFVGTVWAQVLPALWMGGTVDILGRIDADQWVDRIARTAAAFTYVSSPRIGEFISALRRRPEALQSLRRVMHSGSAAPRSLLIELFDAVGDRLTEHWGSTEIVGSLTATFPYDYSSDSPAEDVFSSVGRPLPTADVAIVGADGSPAGPGVAGEMVVRSDSMFSGYWRAPEKNIEAFRDGWYRTADVGYRDPSGYIYLVGRSADLIVSGGVNVYPAEVERVIQEMDAVDEVAVFGVPHERWGETVVAAVVLRRGASLTQDAVVEHCANQLAGYKKPTRVLVVDELPTNASHKLDRNAVREKFLTNAGPLTDTTATATDA
jgi:acyl-CoA synthetase (AMP-forming)/AMP-acid ligase II